MSAEPENPPAPAADAPPRLCGFWLRALATAVDTVVFLPAALLVLAVGTGRLAVEQLSGWPVTLAIAAATVALWNWRGATPGKELLGLKIVDAETLGAPSVRRLTGRYAGYYVSLLPLFLGFFWAAWDSRKQCWHDKLAGTLVIRRPGGASPVKVACALGLIAVLGTALLALGVAAWIKANKDSLQGLGAEAEAFAAGKSEADCLGELFRRFDAAPGMVSAATSSLFGRACLAKASAQPGFCDGVPSDSELLATGVWRAARCAELGRSDPYCGNLLAAVQRHCHNPGRVPAGPAAAGPP